MSDIAEKSDRQKGAEAAVESFRKELGPFVAAAETIRLPHAVHGCEIPETVSVSSFLLI
ncbi:hypothetical protein IQ17_01195 [Bradyrhizobium daqingense]|uniref:Uncharacterized protein n=1 Tax=Bradyrhizobium daqingense TaxID=993502 RepID=A0A562LL97_9BRAD|nr:hypothetical protein IQ17_01195 [Bradyrhizobium daqingense]